jgi:hypothetical protein
MLLSLIVKQQATMPVEAVEMNPVLGHHISARRGSTTTTETQTCSNAAGRHASSSGTDTRAVETSC